MRLVTREDRGHLHKLLGFGALAHFWYRLGWCRRMAHCGMGGDVGTLLGILVHAALSLSSLAFRLPRRRHGSGIMIWPEYRAHSIIFAGRSILCLLMWWFNARFRSRVGRARALVVRPTPDLARFAVGAGAMLAAALASRRLPAESTTVRGFRTPRLVQLGFSYFQMLAWHGSLAQHTPARLHLTMLLVVQLNAFLFTLRRKAILPAWANLPIYGFTLVAGGSAHFADLAHLLRKSPARMVASLTPGVALLLRVLGLSKYFTWGVLQAATAWVGRRSVWPAIAVFGAAKLVDAHLLPKPKSDIT